MSRFRDYVTDVAFRLTLGKTHITALAAVRAGDPSIALGMGLWVTGIRALEARGLVKSLPLYDTPNGNYSEGAKFISENGDKPFWKRHKLTEEGELVWQLLLLADLVREVKPRRDRKAA